MKLVPIVAAWIAGTFIALEANPSLATLVLFSLASIFLALLLFRLGMSVTAPVLLLVLMVGIIRVEAADRGPGPIITDLTQGFGVVKVQGRFSATLNHRPPERGFISPFS